MDIKLDMSEINNDEQSSSSLAICINNQLDTISSSLPKYNIFKVHTLLRRENEMAYELEIVSIGPHHRGKDRLRVMEDQKLRWFKSNLDLLGERDATKYVEAMRRLEPEARQCYSESTEHMNEDEFVRMLLLDGCFIIQFIRNFTCDKRIKYDYFFQTWTFFSTMSDMRLFENQIPMFVLQKLFSMIKLPQEPDYFHEFALNVLTEFLDIVFGISDNFTGLLLNSSHDNDIHHMLGLLHYILRSLGVSDDNTDLEDSDNNMNDPSDNDDSTHASSSSDQRNDSFVNDDDDSTHEDNEISKAKWILQLCERGFKFFNKVITNQLCRRKQDAYTNWDFETIPSASKLYAAGVEFKRNEIDNNPFEITFENGVMNIPTLRVQDIIENLYRNLIAYEQYNQEDRNRCVGFHAEVLDYLIDSAEDVALLRKFGIIHNVLGDDEAVSRMFNKLIIQVWVSTQPYKSKLFKEVNEYYWKRRHRWMAKLRLEYFNSPWAWISFLAAFLLLIFTLTQTVFSILGGV